MTKNPGGKTLRKNRLRIPAALAGLALACFAAERIFLHGGSHGHWWDGIPVFYGLFGGLGAIVLIFTAKILVMRLIKRPEDYYDGI